jgi:hypothetical protein
MCLADPRPKSTDYPAHAESAHVSLGAEYLVHSFSNGRQTYFVPACLVVDTAVYPHGPLLIKPGNFRLRLNGTTMLSPQAPGMVAYSLNGPGFGDEQPRHQPRFPGDNSGNYPPQAPQAPDPAHPEREGTEPVAEALARTALQDGEFHSAQSGFLYFPFNGKLKKVKSMDLVYSDEAGELVVKIF